MVQFEPVADKQVTYVTAAICSKHTGVFNPDGSRKKPKHNMFVDDNLMAETRAFICIAMVASIEALFRIFG